MAADLPADLLEDATRLRTAPSGDQLNELQKMGRELTQLEKDIAQKQAELTELSQRRQEMVQRTLPDFMLGLGLDRIGLEGEDADIVCRPYYHASIPKESADEAHAWLEANDFGDLIKCTVTVQFGKEQLALARALAAAMPFLPAVVDELLSLGLVTHEQCVEIGGAAGQIPEADVKRGVHFATLTSWLREQHERNLEIEDEDERLELPLALLGATIGRVVEIKQRQNAKSKPKKR